MVGRWQAMRKGDVVERLLGPMAPLTLLRLLGETLEVPGVHLAGLHEPRAPEGEPRALARLAGAASQRRRRDRRSGMRRGDLAGARSAGGVRGDPGAGAALERRPALRRRPAARRARARLGGHPAALPTRARDPSAVGGRALHRRRHPPQRADRPRHRARCAAHHRRRVRAPGPRRARWSHRPHRASRTSPPTCSTACSSTRWPTTFAGSWPSTRSSSKAPPPGRPPGRAPTASPAGTSRTGGSPAR